MKIRHKFFLTVLPAVLAVLIGLTYLSYATSRKALMREIEARARVTLDASVLRLDGILESIEDALQVLHLSLEVLGPDSGQEVKKLIQEFLRWNPEVYGTAIAFRPGSFPSATGPFSPYYHREGAGLRYMDLGDPSYDYPARNWYRLPAETGKLVWSRPYMDTGGGDVDMVTCSCPFFRDGKFWGVVTADLSLDRLTEITRNIVIGRTGYAFLMTDQGVLLSRGGKRWEPGEDIFTVADRMNSRAFRALGKKMTAGASGFESMREPLSGVRVWVVYGPVAGAGWSMGILFPEAELMGDLNELHGRMILIAVAGMLFLVGILFLLSTRISRPVGELASRARRIAGGDFSEKILDPGTRDEVGMLTGAFNEMQRSLSTLMEKLNTEKEQFSVAFSEMPAGLVILDDTWNLLKYNRSAETLLQLDPSRSLAENLRDRFDVTGAPEDLESVREKQISFELRRKENEDTADLVLACTLTQIHDGASDLRERILTLRDVSDEATEETFKQNFLSLISHKLLTPITVMRCSLDFLQDGVLGELNTEQKENTEALEEQIQKLQALIERLVSFVALEGAPPDGSVEAVHLPGLLEELAGEMSARFHEKGARVVLDPASTVDTIRFNRKVFSLLLGQLLENGLKFNRSASPCVTVRCSGENGDAVITVTDNGNGIPPEYQDKIFDKFFQIEKYFTGNVEGAGLGLAYVKKVVDAFGGEVDVSSEPGAGSRFTVRLPRCLPPDEGAG